MDLAQWEADVVLADGGTVYVRPIRPDDAVRMVDFHSRQSAESIYFRYFSPRPTLSAAEVHHATHVDYRDRMAFIALLGETLVAVARYDRPAGREAAEVAFFVDEEHKGRGLATILLEYLAAFAREAGIPNFVATVLPSNRRMIGVFQQVGFEVATEFSDGLIEVVLAIDPTDEALAAMEERAGHAEARSVARLLEPGSVAVIGAGRERGGVGHEVVRRLLEHGFAGPVYPVNRDAAHVASVRAYASILDVPDHVDLAVIAVPASDAPGVVTECALAGVTGLVIISAGLGETGSEGLAVERDLVHEARRHGLRVVGPNALGVVNTRPDIRLHATFVPVDVRPGGVALSAQSGTLAAAILDRAHSLGIGLSSFVSLGNKADVSSNDLLRYWEDDERTSVVLLYLESFGNPRHFGRVVRRVARAKPVVAVKPGRDRLTDVLLSQSGVIRVETLDQLLDVARVLASQPVPAGRRVAVVGNSDGAGHLAAAACQGAGLELARLDPATRSALDQVLPTGARTANPVDLTYRAGAEHYEDALRLVLADEAVEAALVLYAPPLVTETDAVVDAVNSAASGRAKTVVASFLGVGLTLGAEPGHGIPNFVFPDSAAYALGRAAVYGEWRLQPPGEEPALDDVDPVGARAVVDGALTARPAGGWLDPEEAHRLVGYAGLAVSDQRVVRSEHESVAAARAVGYPVALKAAGVTQPAKTEAGGVALDLHDDVAVERAFARMRKRFGAAMDAAVVQRMVEPGVDLRVVVRHNDVVGAMVAAGPGGAGMEAAGGESIGPVPLTDLGARRLLETSAVAGSLGQGERREAAEELLLRVGWLADVAPELAELTLNPVIVGSSGAVVTNVRARIAPLPVAPPSVRRL